MARLFVRLCLIPALPFLFLLPGHSVRPAAAEEAGGHFRLTDATVHVYDLAGHVDLVAGSGSAVQVDVTFHGADASRLAVANLSKGGAALVVKFPTDHIRWAEPGDRSSTTVRVNDDGTFHESRHDNLARGRRVRIDDRPGGLDASADLRIAVPKGQRLTVHVGVGRVTVTNVDGALAVDCAASSVDVNGARGALDVATGSGDIAAHEVTGEQSFTTGSGSVNAGRLEGAAVLITTGSGDVTAQGVTTPRLKAETGSGEVSLSGVAASDLQVRTGSGGVSVQLVKDVDRVKIGTGSGDVRITAPDDLDAALRVDTGSGGIESDFTLSNLRRGEGSLTGVIGGGRGKIVVETGSGSVKLLKRSSRT